MMVWVFGAMTLAAVLMATLESQLKRAILVLWAASIGVGALYLTVGAEFLAVIQWIVATVVAIAFTFFSVLFGEYHPVQPPVSSSNKQRRTLRVGLAMCLGVVFAIIIGIGSQDLMSDQRNLVVQESHLGVLGKKLTQDHILSLEVLALTLFLVLVGGGVIVRSEGDDSQ